ncbi:unnamed protein product [Phytophthora fragariaefolia]|uniref:Unnamed protein product n=1 Tax=Phytophthora fragariaefolia TaxID=1490495 RepID=A0A9W6UDA2_9STRA|nr:unnamed protein product [Phytophthora fragariaefolia]
MDTAPGFAPQMECIVLAYQSDAPVDALNSVVNQDLWVRRKFVGEKVEGGAADQDALKKAVETADTHSESGEKSAVKFGVKNSVGGATAAPEAGKAMIAEAPTKSSKSVQVENTEWAGSGGKIAALGLKNTPAELNAAIKDSGGMRVTEAKLTINGDATVKIISTASRVLTQDKKKVSESAHQETKKSRVRDSQADAEDSKGAKESSNTAAVLGPRDRNENQKATRRKPESGTAMTEQHAAQETNAGTGTQMDFAESSCRDGARTEAKKMAKSTVSASKRREGAVEKKGKNENLNTGSSASCKSPRTSGQNEDYIHIDEELCKVARDLEAGDEVYGLQVAKERFQSMLDNLVQVGTSNPKTSRSKSAKQVNPINKLCATKHRSPEQTREFKTRLRDTIEIVDALLCKPPPGLSCSQDCKAICAQMCNEFTPCINPTCLAWHNAENHAEECPNEHCEFKIRVMLRETMHLIEHKQQEIASASDSLKCAKITLLSSTRRSNHVGNAGTFKLIDAQEQDLDNLNGELLLLLDTKREHLATLSTIGIDAQSDKVDGLPDFGSHYTTRSHKRKKP